MTDKEIFRIDGEGGKDTRQVFAQQAASGRSPESRNKGRDCYPGCRERGTVTAFTCI